jgi:hypothetical protein
MGGWIMFDGIQQDLGAIYKEGGGVNNFAFITGNGNVLMAQQADTGDDNVQAYSDFRLIPDRPYHIAFRMTYLENPQEFRLFIDGVEMEVTDGNPLTSAGDHMDAHSGDINWGDPDANLETGGTDIAYAGQVHTYMAHWHTWSDNSPGTNAGALDKTTEIREILFEQGAPADTIITSDTEANMQTDLDAEADTTYPDWPCALRIERVTGGGDLELTADNINFDPRGSIDIQWLGKTGETLTWVNSNGGSVDTNKISTPRGGTVVIAEDVPVKITAKDIDTKSAVQNARVIVTVPETTTYYFDGSDVAASDPDSAWTDETNADDGSTSTGASSSTVGSATSNELVVEGTNAPSSGDNITQVRARFYGVEGGVNSSGIEIYTDGESETLFSQTGLLGSTEGWTAYQTLTEPSGGWTWAKIQALEFKIWVDSLLTGSVAIHVAEIEVTTDNPIINARP